MAIAHDARRPRRARPRARGAPAVLTRGRPSPSSPPCCKAFGLTTATSDRYAGSWPTEAFRKHGITVEPSDAHEARFTKLRCRR